jgi:FKBP-type peptidyl-prolyl cis-trans isomerase SlyD
MNVSEGHFVRIDCELRVSGGEVIESSAKSGPVEYKHGAGQLLPALESRLAGMSVGAEKSGVIPAAEAFGAASAQPTMTIPRGEFPADAKISKGSRFEAKGPKGAAVTLEVQSVDKEKVIARVVHALADKDLEFRVKVLAIRPPPPPVPKSPADELELTEVTDAD